MAELGALPVHGVALRPASPTGLGFIGNVPVVLLPGNPVSCLCAYDFFAGPILRRVGLLIEIVCLLAILAVDADGGRQTLGGIAVRDLLMAGLAVGFVVWGVGLGLWARAARRPRSSD